MFKFYFILFFGFFCQLPTFAQAYEFYGVIKLNGKMESAIPYRLIFNEKDGKIKGYSITDMTGEHETKNFVDGYYDTEKKYLSFKEKNIIYTKSPISDESFCFISFEGKIKLNTKKPKIEGKFKGYFKNKTKCIDGTIELVSSLTVQSYLNKANKKIQKSKELDDDTKKKYNPIQIFDSLQTNQLTTSQNLNVFNKSDKVSFEIWDNSVEDGDIINLSHNGKMILENYTVSKVRKKVELALESAQNVFTIEAVNEGSQAPNTAMIILQGDKTVEFQSNLKVGQKATVTIIKEKD